MFREAGLAYGQPMLLGRATERAAIDRLLHEAREGRGGALVLRGEAGIGKTALLDHAAERSSGMRVLRVIGVESEASLPFSALHELLHPLLGSIDRLPGPQRRALRAALAMDDEAVRDRFAVYAAALGLLLVESEDLPVLCLVDDAHWMDGASADAMLFAARRLEAERVAVVFSARDPDPSPFLAPGLPVISVTGLPPEDARALLTATPAPVSPRASPSA